MLEQAIKYARMGLSVIPVHSVSNGKCSCGFPRCSSPGKHPRIKWKDNTKVAFTPEQLREWWEQFPESNVGIVTGEISGIVVIDVDGEEGLKSMLDAGLDVNELPPTVKSKTGGGGLHLIYRYPEKGKAVTKSGILHKVDIRADGGFIVAPPSLHVSGNKYEWINSIEDMDPAEFDFSLLPGVVESSHEEKAPSQEAKVDLSSAWHSKLIQGVESGGRNDAATRLAGRYFGMGMTSIEVRLMMRAWNTQNSPPLSQKELDTVLNSIRDREYAEEIKERSEYLSDLSTVLKVRVISVKMITGDDPKFILQFESGVAAMSSADLFSPKAFQQKVAEATKVVIDKLSAKTNPTHDSMVQMILNCAEDIDAGMEATQVGELMLILQDFIRNQSQIIPIEDGEGFPARGSFKYADRVWVSLMDVVQRSSQRWGIRLTGAQLAQRLKGFGVDSRVFSCDDGAIRTLWGIEPDSYKMMEQGGSL